MRALRGMRERAVKTVKQFSWGAVDDGRPVWWAVRRRIVLEFYRHPGRR